MDSLWIPKGFPKDSYKDPLWNLKLHCDHDSSQLSVALAATASASRRGAAGAPTLGRRSFEAPAAATQVTPSTPEARLVFQRGSY